MSIDNNLWELFTVTDLRHRQGRSAAICPQVMKGLSFTPPPPKEANNLWLQQWLGAACISFL
jgi:uncharacterized protein YbbK (DUF523 family)